MIEWAGKRYWLVGASEGLGAALAHKMSAAGVHLVLSARSEDKLRELAASLPGKADVVTVDVSDAELVKAAAAAVGDIDGVVQIAGVYWPFGANNWDADQATAMADINFTGAMRLMGAVVPKFVERDAGHIVLTGSLSGFRGLPGAAAYTSSKAGVMTLAESLYADLRKTNVRVQLVNPGFVKTRLTDKNDFKMPFIMEPEDAAREFFEHMNTDAFKRSFPTLFSWVFRGSQFLPDWLYYRLFA
ncbi:SDR family NAD(P)-dependent oxidoreductase [Marivita sp.]|uniref:SDR family NAD(P)-dependent oxidoreductase n=1 Tax=Marivita sp. TaxID=2003365 RepID=UPI003A84D8FD